MKNTQTPEKVEKLIHSFRLELLAPACIPGADTWNAKADLEWILVESSRISTLN